MVSNAVTFWSYLTVLIPSYFCLFFVLYYLLFDRSLRHGLNNHVILVILIIDLICEVLLYPWLLYFSYSDGIWIRSIVMCEIWSFMDWGLYITHTMLFSWATIERHILIFHDKWVSTKKKRLFVHYLPLILLVVYCVIFYSVINFFPPCQNILYNPYADCLFNCVYYSYIFTMYETVVHQIIPIFAILIFSIALILRVLWQKHRMHQPVQWRKHRKMTIQLLSVSLLYLIFFFPLTICVIINLCGVRNPALHAVRTYADFFSYFMQPLFPIVCLFSLPELRTKLTNILHLRRQIRRVGPSVLGKTAGVNRQIQAQ